MDVLSKGFNHIPVQSYQHQHAHQPLKSSGHPKESKINTSLTSADLSLLDNENFLIKEITSTKLDLLNNSGSPVHFANHSNDQEKPKSGFLNSKFFLSQTPECGLCKNSHAHDTQKLMEEMIDMDSGIQSRYVNDLPRHFALEFQRFFHDHPIIERINFFLINESSSSDRIA